MNWMPDVTNLPIRCSIIAEARSWIGTPYHHQAALKGVGYDCLGFVRGVWRAISVSTKPAAAQNRLSHPSRTYH